ncbi:hypothetical protein [Ruminococcus flavefaciens]|uniref:hypothetical protein n=1 Tax=Ruminococcus flavefaciens TaxID=1265 RepID=UPI00048C5396|nr:hypothetical protein [Ruminococcus flavefaciens]
MPYSNELMSIRKNTASELKKILGFDRNLTYDKYKDSAFESENIYAQINKIVYHSKNFYISGDLFTDSLIEYDEYYFNEQQRLPRPVVCFFETRIPLKAIIEPKDYLSETLKKELQDQINIVSTEGSDKHDIKIETNIEQKLDQMTDELYNNLLLISLSDRRDGYRSRIYFSASPFRQNITYIKFVCQTDNHVPLTLPTLSELNSNDVTSILNSIEPQILNVYNVGQGNFTELIDNKGFQRKIVFDPGITCTKSHNPYDLAIKEYGQLNADCFFISHFDTDHFLGIIYLKDDQFQSNKLWIAPDPTSIKKLSTSARRIIWFLHNNAKFRIIKDSTSYYTFNKKIKVFRGTADPKSVTDNGKYINGSGIMISVEGKRKTALLTGDCLYEYWNKDVPEECDYLVVPHHGCKVDAVKIEGKQTDRSEAIISVGNGNSYGHPNSQHIKKLLDKGFNSVLLTKNITLKVYDLD